MKGLLVLILVGMAAAASANAVMGYALEQYDRQAWVVYVIGTIVFEAWAVGRWAGSDWPAAVGISVLANLVTAGCCANLCGVGLHNTFVGSPLNPNPLMNMLLMFTVFALISGFIEGGVWTLFYRGKDRRVAGRSIVAHLVWVPIGMIIMLVPSRPYPFIESNAMMYRRWFLQDVRPLLDREISEKNRIPDHTDTVRLFRETVPPSGIAQQDAWAAAYRPTFGRFSTGTSKDELLFEWNPAATGLKVDSDKMPDPIWLLRTKRKGDQPIFGLIWSGSTTFTNDPTALGYR